MSIKSKEDLLNKQAEVNEQIKSYTCRVLVCSGTGCIASGAQKIYEEMSVLCERIDGVTVEMQKDVPHVGVIKTGCQGLCELGPLMRIEPYDYQYVHVQPEDSRPFDAVPQMKKPCSSQGRMERSAIFTIGSSSIINILYIKVLSVGKSGCDF